MTIATPEARIRIRDTRDLLSVIPYVLGYRPAQCVVIVCIRGAGELGLVARTALSDLRDIADRARIAQLVARRAAEDGAGYAYVVAYAADELAPPAGLDRLVGGFVTALGAYSIDSETWLVDSRVFRSLSCADPACCNPAGYPVTGLDATVPGTQLVVAGVAPAATREELLAIKPSSTAARGSARKAAVRWAAERGTDLAQVAAWRRKSAALWATATSREEVGAPASACDLGRLSAALQDPVVRDEVLAKAATTRPGVAAARAGEVLTAVVAHSTRARQVQPLAILGYLAWLAGDGARANYRIEQALRIDPNCHLARLMAAALESGLPPAWIADRGLESADAPQILRRSTPG